MHMAQTGHVVCTSSSHSVWSFTPCQYERPTAVVPHSICTHAPLRSFTEVPLLDEAGSPSRGLPPAHTPYRAYNDTPAQTQQQRLLHRKQQTLEQLIRPTADPRDTALDLQQYGPQASLQHSLQQQACVHAEDALTRLQAAAKWRLQLDPSELRSLLQHLQPQLHALQPGQLAHAAHAVSVLPGGPTAAAGLPGWEGSMLAASAQLFAAGLMDDWASSVLLQALVKSNIRPDAAWLQTACAGMHVGSWTSSRALSTVAACLPQLGHVPSNTWAAALLAATTKQLQDMPAVSLARLLHGVVAWRHLQQQQKQQQHGEAESFEQQQGFVLPDDWVCAVLQQLTACSSELKPVEVAMILQTLARMQQHEATKLLDIPVTAAAAAAATEAVAAGDHQAGSMLQHCMQQLLHALVPAVAQQRRHFKAHDFAVVLHSLALLQTQSQQQQQQVQQTQQATEHLLGWDWLALVLPAVQECLPHANARTQTTTLWAAAVLLQPHLRNQAAQQQQLQRQQQQHSMLQQQLQRANLEQVASAAVEALQAQHEQEQQAKQHEQAHQQGKSGASLVRPVWQGSRQQQPSQAAAAAALAQLTAAAAPTSAAAGASHPTAGHTSTSSSGGGTTLSAALSALTAAPTASGNGPTPLLTAFAPAAAPDANALWLTWLDSFYAASLPHLHSFSPTDLVVATTCFATQQQVPPVAWYEQLLAATQAQLHVMTPGQHAGLAWGLGRMALLPCRHDPRAALVPTQAWLAALYARTGLAQQIPAGFAPAATGAAAAARGVLNAVPQAAAGILGSSRRSQLGSRQVVWLMWCAAACEYDPGDDWWRAAEQLLLTPGAWQHHQQQEDFLISEMAAWQQQQLLQQGGWYVDTAFRHQEQQAGLLRPDMPPPPEKQQQSPPPAVTNLPTRLLGALLQAYAASGRPLPLDLARSLLSPTVVQALCREPLVNTVRLLKCLAGTSISSTSQQPTGDMGDVGVSSGVSGSGRGGGDMHGVTAQGLAHSRQQWLQGLALGLQDRLVGLGPQEVEVLLEALAAAGLRAGPWCLMEQASASSSSSSRSGAGTRDAAAGDSWVVSLAHACQRNLRAMTAREISTLLSTAAKLQLQLPTQLVQSLLQQMQLGLLDASPSALAASIDAVTRLGLVPSRDWLGSFLMATHRTFTAAAAASSGRSGLPSSAVASLSARRALVESILKTLQGLSRLSTAPPPKWLKQQLLLLHGQLPLLQPRDIARLLLLLARLKCRPSPMYLQSMLRQLGDCSTCSPKDLVQIAYGIASLRWQPNRQWMQLFLAASGSKLDQMTNQGLALMHWALGVTRVMPALTWRRLALQAVAARVGELDVLQLSMVVWAWGQLQVHLTPYTPLARKSLGLAPIRRPGLQQQQLRIQRQRQGQQLTSPAAAVLPTAEDSTGVVSSEVAHTGTDTTSSSGGSSAVSSAADAAVGRPSARAAAALQEWQRRRQVAQALLGRVLQLRGQFNSRQLCHLLAGLAKMRVYPTQAWLHAVVTQGSQQALTAGLDGYQMQQLLWALARLQYRAPIGWVDLMGDVLDTKWQQNLNTRKSAMWAVDVLRDLAVRGPAGSVASTDS